MANVLITPNMKLPNPNLNDPGPDYASNVSTSLNIIDAHDHDGVNGGVLINIAGQEVLSDLSLQGHNLTNVRSIDFISQPSALTNPQDVNCVYVNQGNLGFNNADGYFVQITDGNSLINITSPNLTNFTIRNVSSNFTIAPLDTYNLININSSGGAVTGILPIASLITPTPAGRLYLFRDVGESAATNPITISITPGSGNTFPDSGLNNFVINNNGGYVGIFTDGVSKWFTFTQKVYNNETINFNDAVINYLTGTQTYYKGSFCYLEESTQLIADNTSTVFLEGNVNIVGAKSIYSDDATTTFDAGTTTNFISGSNLSLNTNLTGVAVPNFTLSGGTINFTNVNSINLNSLLTTVTGAGTQIQGTYDINNSAVFTYGQSSGIVMDNTCTLTNSGASILSQMCYHVHTVPWVVGTNSYTLDSGFVYDYYVALRVGDAGTTGGVVNQSVWSINLPASPRTGRVVIIGDNTAVLYGDTGNFRISISGNGNQISVPTDAGGFAGSLIGQAGTGDNISAYVTNTSGFNIEFLFDGNNWITLRISDF